MGSWSGAGRQSIEEEIPLLRITGSILVVKVSYLELGDQLVLGLFLGLDLVDVVVAGGGPGSVHRRTTRVAPRQRGGVVRWFLKMIWTDYQETARGNELLLRDVGEDSFCDASFS
jgi:hypothetical protein